MGNRAAKMSLFATFLVYPFVSQVTALYVYCCMQRGWSTADPALIHPLLQTMFQSFSCHKLSEDEQWLRVDYKIGCHQDTYQAFLPTLGLLGIVAFPIGIPVISLLLLLKNHKGIRAEGPARDRYDFLVADYKPAYYYWDCVRSPGPAWHRDSIGLPPTSC